VIDLWICTGNGCNKGPEALEFVKSTEMIRGIDAQERHILRGSDRDDGVSLGTELHCLCLVTRRLREIALAIIGAPDIQQYPWEIGVL
jgi:hypothetical protein